MTPTPHSLKILETQTLSPLALLLLCLLCFGLVSLDSDSAISMTAVVVLTAHSPLGSTTLLDSSTILVAIQGNDSVPLLAMLRFALGTVLFALAMTMWV